MLEVAQMPALIWIRVARAIGCSPQELEHRALLAMLVTVGFVWREAFAEVWALSLRLTQGDIRANVEDFMEHPELATDKVSRRWLRSIAAGGIGADEAPRRGAVDPVREEVRDELLQRVDDDPPVEGGGAQVVVDLSITIKVPD